MYTHLKTVKLQKKVKKANLYSALYISSLSLKRSDVLQDVSSDLRHWSSLSSINRRQHLYQTSDAVFSKVKTLQFTCCQVSFRHCINQVQTIAKNSRIPNSLILLGVAD